MDTSTRRSYQKEPLFDFKLSDVLEDDTEPKIVLIPQQEAKLLSFKESEKVYEKYRDEIIILLEMGLRV